MKLLENKKYLEQYHSYLRILAVKYIAGGEMQKTMNSIQKQIDTLVGAETNAFITNDAYKQAVPELIKLVIR